MVVFVKRESAHWTEADETNKQKRARQLGDKGYQGEGEFQNVIVLAITGELNKFSLQKIPYRRRLKGHTMLRGEGIGSYSKFLLT